MSLLYLNAETGEIVARTPINFGAGVDSSRLTSEQSVAVRGCQAFVVNNYVGTDGLDPDTHCTYAPTDSFKQSLAGFCNVRPLSSPLPPSLPPTHPPTYLPTKHISLFNLPSLVRSVLLFSVVWASVLLCTHSHQKVALSKSGRGTT